MILKFVKLTTDEERVFDRIDQYVLKKNREVDYTKDAVEERFKNVDLDITDTSFQEGQIPKGKRFKYHEIRCRNDEGVEFSIVFNCTLFVSNGVGKTIDKVLF